MRADDGPCKAMIKRFFQYSHQQCEEFIYGGCEGNQNRFETLEECKQNVQEVGFETLITPETSGYLI